MVYRIVSYPSRGGDGIGDSAGWARKVAFA